MKKVLAPILAVASIGLAAPAFADMFTPAPGVGTAVSGPAAHGRAQANSGIVEKSDLMGRKVIDGAGAPVGQVKDVVTDGQGQPVNIVIATSKKDVSLPAAEVKLAGNDTLKTDKSAGEIGKMSAASTRADTSQQRSDAQ